MQKIYSCFIVDDDEVDRLTITSYVRRHPFLQIAGVFESANEALVAAEKSTPDVLFLDIDMPGTNGLDLRRQLEKVSACIFITTFPDYAVESFEVSALDFIVKPVNAERFARCMARLEAFLNIQHKAALLDFNLGGDAVFIKEGHDHIKVRLSEIVYLEALRDYTSIVTAKKKYCVLSTLGNLLEQKVFQAFIRIHRSYAVQKHFISRISTKEVEVLDIKLPVGRSYKESLDYLKPGSL